MVENQKIICELCGLEMRNRLNGSHLKRRHNITIDKYRDMFPNKSIGIYKTNIFVCKVCNKKISSQSSVKINHLKQHCLSVDKYNILYEKQLCNCGCGNVSTYSYKRHKFNNFLIGHYKCWNFGLTKETDNRILNQSKKLKNKKLSNEHKLKIKNGLIGHWTPEKIERMKKAYEKTMMKQHGVKNYWMTDECKKKLKETSLQKYGTEYPMQNATISKKSHQNCAKMKEYILPSGKIIKIRGYEPFLITQLLNKYDEKDIITDETEMDIFWYRWKGKIRRYFPDVLIQSINKYYEVKSTRTYYPDKKRCDLKCKSVVDKGYDISLIVFDYKGNILLNKNY